MKKLMQVACFWSHPFASVHKAHAILLLASTQLVSFFSPVGPYPSHIADTPPSCHLASHAQVHAASMREGQARILAKHIFTPNKAKQTPQTFQDISSAAYAHWAHRIQLKSIRNAMDLLWLDMASVRIPAGVKTHHLPASQRTIFYEVTKGISDTHYRTLQTNMFLPPSNLGFLDVCVLKVWCQSKLNGQPIE